MAPASADTPLPTYDQEGRLIDSNGYSEDTKFRSVGPAPLSATVLADWKWESGGELIDPVQGSTATMLKFSSAASELKSIVDLGRPENLQVQRALGLEAELERADMVAAAKRQVQGTTFYDYDLALSPKQCGQEMATACLPEKVILVSCCVRDGQLHYLRIDASAVQWKRAGAALRLLRSSFAVASSGA